MTKIDLRAPLDQVVAGVGSVAHKNWSTLMAKALLKQLETSMAWG